MPGHASQYTTDLVVHQCSSRCSIGMRLGKQPVQKFIGCLWHPPSPGWHSLHSRVRAGLPQALITVGEMSLQLMYFLMTFKTLYNVCIFLFFVFIFFFFPSLTVSKRTLRELYYGQVKGSIFGYKQQAPSCILVCNKDVHRLPDNTAASTSKIFKQSFRDITRPKGSWYHKHVKVE